MEIRFYNKSEKAKDIELSHDPLTNFLDSANDAEIELIDKNWASREQEIWGGGKKYTNGEMLNVYSIEEQESKLLVHTNRSRYAVHDALGRTPHNLFSEEFIEKSRILCTSITITTADGMIISQKRGEGILAAGCYDSSAAGICYLRGEDIVKPQQIMQGRLSEISLSLEDLESYHTSGLHRGMDYLTPQQTFVGKTILTFAEIKSRIDNNKVAGLVPVPQDNLVDFIVDHGVKKGNLIADGAASMLQSLQYNKFLEAVREIKSAGGIINFGTISKGKFIVDEELEALVA